MAAMAFNDVFFNHEIPFCKVYSLESKEKLEKLFLKNSISFCVEWQERKPWSRFLGNSSREKNTYTIRINEADQMLARTLVEGMEYVTLS